jgi:hypothetical protein
MLAKAVASARLAILPPWGKRSHLSLRDLSRKRLRSQWLRRGRVTLEMVYLAELEEGFTR